MFGIELSMIWAVLIAVAVFLYVALDGFDLGVGILFPFAKDRHERDQMQAAIAPVWDGNETWLVLGGGGLFAAFPESVRGADAGAVPADLS
jgi:cytochrome d ubiquinol oxidase subunit II